MERDELLQRYAAGERSFVGVSLLSQDLSRSTLAGIDLTGAQLRGSSFEDADLTGAVLRNASLEVSFDGLARVNLKRANLSGADLGGANLSAVLLQGAYLRHASLTGARLNGAHLTAADLTHADLTGADLSPGVGATILSGTNLQAADFSDSDLSFAVLDGAVLEGARFDRATVVGVTWVADGEWPIVDDSPVQIGTPAPLGAQWIAGEQAWNFALYSKAAAAVTLLLYQAEDLVHPALRVSMDYLRHRTGRVWHCRLDAATVGTAVYYAYTIDGPAAPGNRFDPQKILFDPYAKCIHTPPDFDPAAARGPGSNAGRALLGALVKTRDFDWEGDRSPRHTSDTVIYEMHVRGFTRRDNSDVAANSRGTYAGVVEKIPYLLELGVNVVELLPVYRWEPEPGGNYWGYMPLSFFVPHAQYSSVSDAWETMDEFRSMVKALHRAGIEVVLDVVYNHTAELGEDGPTFSYRGIDNSTYYLLSDDLRRYNNDAGTGNVLRTGHPAVRQLVLDSLRFWVNEMHVDGFRFDLASIFTRSVDGRIDLADPPILAQISSDPDFRNVRLIAEPWDLAAYHLGRSFPATSWMQWNGRFRDHVRSWVRGESGHIAGLMRALYGSDDLFPDSYPERFRPYQSLNYVTCHDGFCLRDLVSYDRKHNQANGHGGADGSDDNRSWNCGWEGDLGVPAEVSALRRRQIKNFCTLVMLANGIPMFLAGDEFFNTQGGNNNPYNQDNATSWLDWDLAQRNADTLRFFRLMVAFRKGNSWIAPGTFWRERVSWYGVDGAVDFGNESRCLAFSVSGRPIYTERKLELPQGIYVMCNAGWDDIDFTIQGPNAPDWSRFVDTGLDPPEDIVDPGREVHLGAPAYTVKARSVVVLVRC